MHLSYSDDAWADWSSDTDFARKVTNTGVELVRGASPEAQPSNTPRIDNNVENNAHKVCHVEGSI